MIVEDVYIVVMEGGYAGSVTICDPSIAEHSIRQLRSGGRKVRVFRDRQSYLDFLKRDEEERRKNLKLQRICL